MLRTALAGTALAAAAALLPATPVGAQPPPAQADTVVLALRPAGPLDTARAPQDAAERAERAAASAPRAAARAHVRHWLEQHGFAVVRSTPWTLTARGPSGRLLHRLPRELRGTVASVVREAPGTMRPRAVPAGWAPGPLRQAYAAEGDGRGTTVATIQFSGWRSADAEVFGRAAGTPVAPGQITTTTVLGASADRPDGAGGDFEVALDVEAVLGAAPAARQRVFVGPNTTSGAIAVYDAVATAAERDGLTAVSISWGACELETPPDLVRALEQNLARMVAAGATVFAASGDAGAYGCAGPNDPDGRLAVDYPASSPSVLGVGGTSMVRTPDGGFAETAWSDGASATEGFAGSATGGGLSAFFPRPVWQRDRVTGRARAVPDLAAVADPRTGVGIYGPDGLGRSSWQVSGGTSVAAPLAAGHLAATLSSYGRTAGLGRISVPLYAATGAVRDVVAGSNHRHRAGRGYDLTTGLGTPQWSRLVPQLLEPALLVERATGRLDVALAPYAPASRTARYGAGETEDQACAAATSSSLPRVLQLADGADRATTAVLAVREDGACRTVAQPLVLDRTPPVATASLATTPRRGVLAVSWRAQDPAPASGVADVAWRVRREDTGAVVAHGTATRGGSALRALPSGVAYRLEVVARDAVGTMSGTAVSPTVVAP